MNNLKNVPKDVSLLFQEIEEAQSNNKNIEGFQYELKKRGYVYNYFTKGLMKLPLVEYLSKNEKGLSIDGLKKEDFQNKGNGYIVVLLKDGNGIYKDVRINLSYNTMWFVGNYAFQSSKYEEEGITNAKTLMGIKEKLKEYILKRGFKDKGQISIEKNKLELEEIEEDEIVFGNCLFCNEKTSKNSLDKKKMCLKCKKNIKYLEDDLKKIYKKHLLAKELKENEVDYINKPYKEKKEINKENILIKYLGNRIKVNVNKKDVKQYMEERDYSYESALRGWYNANVEGEKGRIVGYNDIGTIAYIDFDNKKIYEVEQSLYYEKSKNVKLEVKNYIFGIYVSDLEILEKESKNKELVIKNEEYKIFGECDLCHKKIPSKELKRGICSTCSNYIKKNNL